MLLLAASGSFGQCQPYWSDRFPRVEIPGAVGTEITSTAVYDDGSGPALYIGIDLTGGGGGSALYKWSGPR
jgi:hypothetical protein